MKLWNSENYPKLRYQTDTKWNKGHLPEMFASYKKFIGSKPQREVLESYYGDTEEQSFDNLWTSVKSGLHKFGRYSTWFYLQHLKHTAGIRINPTSLMLNDFDGSRSHRNGLLLALGQDDNYDVKLTAGDYSRLEQEAKEIIQETRERFPNIANKVDFFTMETCLCSYKKIFREHHGRYLGYYLDRQSEEIQMAEGDRWHGIDWDVLWQARDETLDPKLTGRKRINKENFSLFVETGRIMRLDWMFNDIENTPMGLEAFL
jgi:hypothetical protein